MMINKLKNKKLFLISIIVIFILIITSVTYAWYLVSANNTDISLVVNNVYFYYDAGQHINVTNMVPVATKEEGIVKDIKVKNMEGNTTTFNLYLKINSLDTGLTLDESFKYAIYNGNTLIATGNFRNKTISNSPITLLSGITATDVLTTYTLYMWLDGTIDNNIEVFEKTFSFTLYGNGGGANEVNQEASGTNVVSLINVEEDSLLDYKIYGNSTQTDFPSPSTPSNVTSLGEDGNIDIVVSGKNLAPAASFSNYTKWDYSSRTSTTVINGQTPGKESDDFFRINGYQSSSSIDTAWKLTSSAISIEGGKTYTFSFYSRTVNNASRQYYGSSVQNYHSIVWSDGTKKVLSGEVTIDSNWQRIVLTDTAPSNATTATLIIGYDSPNIYGIDSYIDVANIQFEENSAATDYNAHISDSTVTIDLSGHEPLRKVGDVSDYIDYKSGSIIRTIGKYTFTGNETWSGAARVGLTWAMQSQAINGYNNLSKVIMAISNKLVGINYYSAATTDSVSLHNNGYGSVIFNLTDATSGLSSSSTESAIATAIQQFCLNQYNGGNPVVVYYQLASSYPEKINLPRVSTPSGDIIVKVTDEDIYPSSIVLNYWNE